MKLRKVLALTLAAAMTLSLAACGGSDEGAAEAPAADDTAAEAPAADDAADDGAAAEEAPATAPAGLTYASVNLGEDYKDLTTRSDNHDQVYPSQDRPRRGRHDSRSDR